MPLLDQIAETAIDTVIGVDPHTWDLPTVKAKLSGKVQHKDRLGTVARERAGFAGGMAKDNFLTI